MTDAEAFIEALTGKFGREDYILRVDPSKGGRPIFVFYFENLPEEGTLTAVTYGLSAGDHPDWRLSKPELIVSLDTADRAWGHAAGFFAAEYRGEKRFRYGDVFTTDAPISDESEMRGYFVFAPSFLRPEEQRLELPGGPVTLTGLYPIYREEVPLLREIGLEAFWHSDGFDLYDVNRPNLGLGR